MADLKRVRVEGSRLVKGGSFPLAFASNGSGYSKDEVAALLKERCHNGYIKSYLKSSGAVIFELGEDAVPDLKDYITLIAEELGDSPFSDITEAKESSKYVSNSCAGYKRYPTKLFLTGAEGEATLVHGHELFDQLLKQAPIFITELLKKGLCVERKLSDKINSVDFDKISDADVDKILVSDFSRGDNSLNVREHCQPLKVYESDAATYPIFFSDAIPVYGDRTGKVTFDDGLSTVGGNGDEISVSHGTQISPYYLDLLVKITSIIGYTHHWKPGDLMIVDNRQVLHSADENTTVRMWDTPGKGYLSDWEKPDKHYIGMRDAPLDCC